MLDIKSFLLKTTENFYNRVNLELDDKSEISLSEFINNPLQLHLQSIIDQDNYVVLRTQIKCSRNKSLIFYKTSAQELIKEDAASHLNIITLSDAPAESLYHILKQVYTPLLTVDNDLVSSKLQQNLSDLESNLRILTHNKSDLQSINVILSISDEIDYWKNVAQKKDGNKKEREAASAFSELLEDINEEIRAMQSNGASEMRDASENIGGILDDIWRLTLFPYSQDRMKHIMDVIGHKISAIIQKTVSSVDIWRVQGGTKDNEVLMTLAECLKVIQTWTDACQSLTETYWPNYALHPWNGKPYVSKFCLNFLNRLNEVHDIRSTHNQIHKLLSNVERKELRTDEMFEPFQNINIWICSGQNKDWDTAVARFSANLRPAEANIAEKLKPRFHNTSTKQMLYEFMRYKTLLDRPVVKRILNGELEIFVLSLDSMLKAIRMQLDSDDAADVKMYRPPEMSTTVQQVQWAKQMESKVSDIKTCAERHLNMFEGSSQLVTLSTQILKELKNMCTQLHEDWSRDLQAQVKSGALQLAVDKPVVEFSPSNNMMVVQFNPRTVSAASDARSMAALGLPPPPPVGEAIDQLALLVHHARQLQQVASFHNTMGERMVPSTRPMMLKAALDLSSLVQDQKAVYWDNEEQVANYADKLKKAVLTLESQNSYLTNQHVAIRNIVAKLMETELLAKQSEWKKHVKDIRDIIEKVEANGYKNTDLWRTHWDWQLYKALECQYMKTLHTLHKHFPNVKVDLVLRGRMVRVQPPIEEIRVQHYNQLRRFISLPAQFVGLQNSLKEGDSIFAAIVEKHSWMGNKSVSQIEATLAAVERACVEWTRRAALACVADLEALCKEHLKQPQDWEINFKACKAYGQAVAKMTFEDEKVDWISIGTATLRREFEAQVRNLWACLISSLQVSCRDDAAILDSFIANATVTLENKMLPKNAKELAEISAKQHALKEKMPEMEKTVEDLKKKGHMLRTWGGDPSVDGTIKEWYKIHEMMVSQEQMFEHQAEIVKSSLSGEWENLNTGIEAWVSRWTQNRLRFEETHGVTYGEMVERCGLVFEAQSQWEKFVNDRDELLKECSKFGMTPNLSDSWKQAQDVMSEELKLWTTLKEYNEEYQPLAEQEWIVFQKKLHLIDELVSKWSAKLEPYTTVTLFLQQELDKYTDLTPLLKYLRGSDFTERHWREVFGLLEMEYKKPDTLQVKDLLGVALNIKKHIKSLQKISTGASSESAIRSALNELELWFAGARLAITYYNDKSQQSIPIVKDFKEILGKIEEQQWVVSSVRGGEAGGAGADACAAWDTRLRAAHELARSTHHAQRRWLYLEPILSSDEGELGAKFRKVDQGFRQVARLLENDPRLSALLQSSRLQPMLDSISEQLLACQSALNQYIDDKRSAFPRLYFLSDDDLLELLGQARTGADGREAVMQTHLKKLFPGITGVRLGPDGMCVTALCSHYGETFQLEHPVDVECAVEIWLKNLESEMRSSIKNVALKCVGTSSLQEQDPFSLPTQILCLAQNIRFTEQAEKAITTKELHKLKANIEKENLYYVKFEVEDENELYKRQALILQCAYYLGVIKTLIGNNVVSTSHWLWQKQLRFYLLNTKEIVAKMGLATISYSYEYLGVNTGQFVRTELADECFLILTQALHLGLVGNPFGPAGTGKTESVKALGGLVGRLVLVFNCDEAMDAKCMGRLLSGLALCGAWGCFDEFNRLTADTLATVSHQFASLLAAMTQKKDTKPTALLNGKQVSVSEWCGLAATMNPVGRGYGGRRALPAALEGLLRPVAMTQPSGEELARHLLAARAVADSHVLAGDLARVFSMASELLSGQRHYDWGLRALKAAVGSSGDALTGAGASKELQAQRAVLRRVLRLNNLSKLTNDDAERFEAILSMVFAGVSEEGASTNTISSSLEATAKSLGLLYNQLQAEKCIELYEQLQQRMGVVIVGPPGSGKSTIRHLLKSVLTQQGKTIVEYIICPKAMSRNCLLGHIDHDTRQWTDGVISATALEISNQSPDVWSWVVCDGDIDPEWIEALNSVLDDNRLLTLPSGWRIQFGQNVNFIFETHSLEHASPATVSRMGIILLSDENSCAQEMLTSWLEKVEIENEMAKIALPLLQKVINKCLQWFSAHRSDIVTKVYNVSMVKQILTQFEYIAQNVGVSVMNTSPEELVYMAVQRSVIGLLKLSAVNSFHEEMSELLGVPPIVPHWVGEWRDNIYLSPRLARIEPAVRAVVTSSNAHLLIVGAAASGKNLLAEHILKDYSITTLITINCTPILEPADIIAELKRHNVVRSGGRGSARGRRGGGARATLFVRSLHRARVDPWGSSLIHAMLLQIIQHGGFWEQSGAHDSGRGVGWCSAQHVRVVATIDAPRLCPRLTAALCIVRLDEPDDEEMLELAGHHLKQSIDKNIQVTDLNNTTRNILKVYKKATEWFYSQPHYKWTASDVQKWCENVKWYSPSNAAELSMAVTAEANNIFRDRLITESEKTKFNTILKDHFKDNVEGVYFAPKLRSSGVYMEAIEHRDWYQSTQKIINQCLTEHEHSVFGDCGAEVCPELAVLCPAMARATNGGIVVCVGSAGVGRSAAAHVVATALPATLIFVNQPNELNSQFKNALTSAGSESNRTLIVISESSANKATLGAIEALQNARSIHAVPRDMMPSLSHAQPSQFLDNVKQNLGIIITLDKSQDNIFDLLEKYPILFEDSHMVWLESWSNETLRQMPQLIIQRLIKDNVTESSSDEHESIPVEGFVKIYNSMETECMQAPCRYVSFVKAYYHIVKRKKESLVQRRDMLSSGVEALRRARTEVVTLQADATQQEAALSDKQAKANQALDQIGATVRAATDRKEEMHALKKSIEEENAKLQIRKKEIEAELASVEPIIAAARSAVGDIRPESLSEIRSLRAPPDVVRDVLEGVLRLMGIADTSWHSMKNFLSKRGVKEDIRCMDASQIAPEAAQSVQKLLDRRGSSFEEKVARRASAACAPLAAWVRANVAYAQALDKVRPLQLQQRDLKQNLQDAEDQLTALSTGLQTVDERVSSLKQQLGTHTRDAATIELRLNNAAQTLDAAKGLLEQLAHEYESWESDLEYISKEISELNVRSLLAAAYIIYLPDVTEPQARAYIDRWGELIDFQDASFSVINFLSTTERQLKWDADGLPLDKSAIKNAVLIDQILEPHKCGFTPLIIDPDGDAITWLKNTVAGFSCDFISQQNDKLHTAIQYAVRLGRVLVITDVDGVHPSWAPLLRGLPPGGAASSGSVRLLLYTRDATLPSRLPPQYSAALSLVHFTARVDGLTDQLVHYALQQQNPEVNDKSREIKLKKATLRKQQHELQENLLKDLSTNGDILHDANLLASLNKTRSSSATIAQSLQVARAVEEQTKTACDAFEPSAKRTAILALAVKELTGHRPLVALPVEAVLDVFVDGIRKGGDQEAIVKYVARRIIERVLLGLHKKDKYTIVMHLLKQVYDDAIPEKLWRSFVGDSDYIEDQNNAGEIKQKHPWIQDHCVKKAAILRATNPEFFNNLKLDNTELWKEFQQSGDLNVIRKLNLSAFENVAAVAALRPESLYRAIVGFVDQILGVGVMTPGGEVETGVRWGASRRPLLLLGAHALEQLAACAAARAAPLTQTWIDDGAGAWEAAVEQARGGSWLAVIVGASPFTNELTSFLADFAQRPAEDFGAEFRLWIVSEDREIPPLISNACVNIVLEAPEGVRNNVLNTLAAWGNYTAPDPKLVRMHACLAFLHAILQARRAYIPEGWSRWYPFEWGDVSACCRAIRAAGAGATARGLVAALYRGRVAAPPDRDLLAALVHDCLGEQTDAHAYRPRGANVQLPTGTQLQAYASALSGLPQTDSPQMLGLPANCRVAWETKAADDIVAGLRELNTAVVVNCKSVDPNPLKPLLALWKKLMSGSPLIKGEYHNEKMRSAVGWWGCVCAGELGEASRAVRALHSALAALARQRTTNRAFVLHKVPEEWQLLWAGPESPDQYLKELCWRAHAAVKRIDAYNHDKDYFPADLDLRSFLQPRRVIAAVRARSAELARCVPDSLTLVARWDCGDVKRAQDGGVIIRGLRLCGARWEAALAPVKSQAAPSEVAPPILFRFLQQESSSSESTAQVPLYCSAARETLVASVPAPLVAPLDHTAALLNAIALCVATV